LPEEERKIDKVALTEDFGYYEFTDTAVRKKLNEIIDHINGDTQC
jgi:hypothetical protein